MLDERQFQKALELLKAQDPAVRKKAVVALARSGNIDAIESIKAVARGDLDPKVRHYARRAVDLLRKKVPSKTDKTKIVVDLSQKASSSDLVLGLSSSDSATRIDAINKMVSLKNDEFYKPLTDRLALENDVFVLATLVKAVGIIGGSKALDIIAVFLEHEDDRIVANAVEGIEASGDIKVYDYLAKYVNHSNNRVAANILKALNNYEGINPLLKIRQMMGSSGVFMRESALFALNGFFISFLFETFEKGLGDSEPRVRDRALMGLESLVRKSYGALSRIKPQSGISFDQEDDMDFVEAPKEIPVDSEGRLRILLKKEEGRPEGEKIRKVESQYLNIDKDSVVVEKSSEDSDYDAVEEAKQRVRFQLQALKSAVESGEKDKVFDFAEKLTNTDNPILKSAILTALGKLGDPNLAELLSRFLGDVDARVRADAIEALINLGVPNLAKYLRPMLNDPAARVRANALIGLVSDPSFDGEKHIMELLLSRSPRTRRSGIFVIKAVKSDHFLSLLEGVIDDPVESVKKMVFEVLVDSWVNGSRSALTILRAAEGLDDSTRKKLEEYDGLSQKNQEELIKIAEHGEKYLRRQAILLLSNQEGQRVDELLEKLSYDKDQAMAAIAKTALKSRK